MFKSSSYCTFGTKPPGSNDETSPARPPKTVPSNPPCAPCWPATVFFFKVLAGACQFDTAWADLRPNHHHPSSPTRSAPNKQTTTHGGGWRMGRISQTCVGWLLAAPGRMGQVERPPQCEVRERCRDCDLVDPENRSPEHVSGRPKAERRDTPRPATPTPPARSGLPRARLWFGSSSDGAARAQARPMRGARWDLVVRARPG